ncbi:PaeR7I family type II restriction endonuclease [Hymenobacter actinosclerus]|uniref:Restriction endonuclease XhoI n=1 Tax=Hymenobacter actinosclerus TaxID=82805 RepID=A0A1I0A3W7_9BACT|nr:PaeR7I family type II restriction endonuclease [Hymenobacter actinosclerus]SES88771.1 Restriction endonuclease XhoI [Hymenobacter actinosclerus]
MPTPLETLFQNLDSELQQAVQYYWNARDQARTRQQTAGRLDTGTRSAVTAGGQMGALEALIVRALRLVGLPNLDIKIGRSEDPASQGRLEIPGYYRPEKKWDMLVLSNGLLIAALEFKSQVGPSFGNNANNRVEEAVGSAEDVWKAYREQRFGPGPRPFLGYLFLLEDCPKVHAPVKLNQPYFPVDPAFVTPRGGTSYAQRYEVLCRRLMHENLYSAACLLLATNATPTTVTQPAPNLTFRWLLAGLVKHAEAVVLGQGS